MKAEILTIGDELLRGEIIDSNKAFLAERLLRIDVETRFQSSVGDDPADMEDALRRAARRADVVLVSGGLGPTRDDLTIDVLAKTFDRKLVLHAPSLAAIRDFFARLGREMAEVNAKQAWLPDGAEVLPNPIGTAPGCLVLAGEVPIFCLPGVPRELERMMDEQVLPRLEARQAGRTVVRARILRTFGMGESNLEEALSDIAQDGAVTLGFRTTFPDNLLRPLARAATVADAEARLDAVCTAIRERLGALVYAEGDEPLEAVAGRLLRERGATLAVAESCTGGLLAERITRVAGASSYFLGGVVAYANTAKQALLGVPADLIGRHGSVSEPVACAMAEGARERFGADFALATTGISGPGGGSAEKPTGTVCIALARADGTHAGRFVFPLDRERHRSLTVQIGLDWVRRTLLGAPLEAPTLMRRPA
ncbi:MAG: competence/damage-inducible protein A [Deltaproteobacteria bacterium]|nr:competence/damage-inducible protein A [Deltaproteobacteria bacterium]